MEELCLMIPKNGAKFEEKLTCGLEKDGILLSNVENAWATNLYRSCK